MTPTTTAPRQPARAPATPRAPRLRLLPRSRSESARAGVAPASAPRPAASPVSGRSPATAAPVLIAGKDPAKRAQVLHDMSQIMPPSTHFEESGTFWEVLVQAPASRIVILSGQLDDVPTETLQHTLAHRHPDLPVITLEPPARPGR